MSIVYSVGPTWKGCPTIRRLVIFGASYCAVENLLSHDATKPTPANPLGVPFPGSEDMELWNEEEKPNWVGYLITKYWPGPRYTPPREPHQPGRLNDQRADWIKHPLLVNDYAKGGDTVVGVARQVRSLFVPGLGKNPMATPWTAEDTLFITWVGINDCASQVPGEVMDNYFAIQDDLYKTGARNFVLIDVPPINRSPAFPKHQEEGAARPYEQWNLNLRKAAEIFSSTHPDSSVFVFSSFQLFNALLDDPVAFGFEETDIRQRRGAFWLDYIHPTSKVHQHIASALAKFLESIPQQSETQSS